MCPVRLAYGITITRSNLRNYIVRKYLKCYIVQNMAFGEALSEHPHPHPFIIFLVGWFVFVSIYFRFLCSVYLNCLSIFLFFPRYTMVFTCSINLFIIILVSYVSF
jgi:hypothetical protein